MISNTRITHTKEVCLFCEMKKFKQALIQHIIDTVGEEYLVDIPNYMTNPINNTVDDILNNLQDNYNQVIPHELHERKDIIKNTMYHSQDLIRAFFSAFKNLPEFPNITGTSYLQHQDINIAFVIIHRKIKFWLSICEWNLMLTEQKTWLGFLKVFWTVHRELWETTDLYVQDLVIYQAEIAHNVLAGMY